MNHTSVEKHSSVGVNSYARRPLGELLVDSGLLTGAELEDALSDQADSGRRLGEILLARDLVSRPALGTALAAQGQGEIATENGFGCGLRDALDLSHRRRRPRQQPAESPARREHLGESPAASAPTREASEVVIVAEAAVWRPLGELLVDSGLLTGAELEDALSAQADSGRRLGEILLARDLVSRPALGTALAAQGQGEIATENGFGCGLRDALDLSHRRRRPPRLARTAN